MRCIRLLVIVGALASGVASAQATPEPSKAASAMRSEPPTERSPEHLWPILLSGLVGAVVGGVVSLITIFANNRHQVRLEKARADAAKDLEVLREKIDKRSKTAEKTATVAADALYACLELLEGMEAMISVAGIIGDPADVPGEDSRERSRRKADARWKWLMKEYDARFQHAFVTAQVHLPEKVGETLERLQKLRWSVHVDQMTHAELVNMGDHRDTEKFFQGGYGSVPKKQISNLRAELKALLRPLILMMDAEQDTTGSGAGPQSR